MSLSLGFVNQIFAFGGVQRLSLPSGLILVMFDTCGPATYSCYRSVLAMYIDVMKLHKTKICYKSEKMMYLEHTALARQTSQTDGTENLS